MPKGLLSSVMPCVSFILYVNFQKGEGEGILFWTYYHITNDMLAKVNYILNHKLIENQVHRDNPVQHDLHIFFGF